MNNEGQWKKTVFSQYNFEYYVHSLPPITLVSTVDIALNLESS